MNEYYMKEALKQAQKAYTEDEIPVGAVIVKDDKIISRAYNQREQTNKIAAHAEILAIEEAAKKLKTWKLDGCDLYVTLEPCLMCYGAIKQSRIKNVYIALRGNKGKEYIYRNYLNEDQSFITNILEEESYQLMKDFFKEKRLRK